MRIDARLIINRFNEYIRPFLLLYVYASQQYRSFHAIHLPAAAAAAAELETLSRHAHQRKKLGKEKKKKKEKKKTNSEWMDLSTPSTIVDLPNG